MTDAVKHTPGKWYTYPFSMTGAVHAGDKPSDELIASVYPNAPDGWNGRDEYERLGETRANARLISASPELLEASKKVLVAWQSLVQGLAQDDRIEDVEFNEFMEMRAAVAKAVGIEPWEVGKFLASETEGR